MKDVDVKTKRQNQEKRIKKGKMLKVKYFIVD